MHAARRGSRADWKYYSDKNQIVIYSIRADSFSTTTARKSFLVVRIYTYVKFNYQNAGTGTSFGGKYISFHHLPGSLKGVGRRFRGRVSGFLYTPYLRLELGLGTYICICGEAETN